MVNLGNENKKPRMLLLLRNSTKKQTEKKVMEDGRIEYDIPLQRSILRPWGEKLGYEVLQEELVEGGVSGYKVSADDRDMIVKLKAMADRHEFEVLGIYMSDRLGRIADETPLIVSFLNARGIKVISYSEGEISAKTHNDKLMTYIRFWQAEGESLKTSIRIKDANEKAVEQGKWRGGTPPYGYRSVSNGTLNFKGRPIFDVEIDPVTSKVVKRIFELYKDNYGTKQIAKVLNDEGIPTTKGTLWANNTVSKILNNKLYIGIYELGKASGNVRVTSPLMENLKFIDEKLFYEVQEMLKNNKLIKGEKRPTVRGSLLLTGLLYCDCGRKYTGHTQTYKKERADGSVWEHECSFYRCGSHRLPKEGQCDRKPIKAQEIEKVIIDDAKKFLIESDIDKLVVDQEQKAKEKEKDLIELQRKINKDYNQNEKEIAKLKEEVYKVIIGESQFTQKLLSDLIETKEIQQTELKEKLTDIDSKVSDLRAIMQNQKTLSNDVKDWGTRFDSQELSEKKAMLINLINKITMYDEKVEIKYKLTFDNFMQNNYTSKDIGEVLCNQQPGLVTQNNSLCMQGNSLCLPKDLLCLGFAQSLTLAKMLAWQIVMQV